MEEQKQKVESNSKENLNKCFTFFFIKGVRVSYSRQKQSATDCKKFNPLMHEQRSRDSRNSK